MSQPEGIKESMVTYQWTTAKPTDPGWYWFRGQAHEADPFIVQIDEAGQFQWADGGYQEVSLAKGEWAGPIEEPKEYKAGPVADQPDRPRTPPGVGTPLQAVGLPGGRHPLESSIVHEGKR